MSAIDTALTGYASSCFGIRPDDFVTLAVLLCYDCLLNLDREIPLIWSRRPTITSVFYVLCRYSMVLYAVLGCVSSSCTAVSNTRHVLGVFFSPVVTVSAYVKVYAVSRRDWRWTSIAVMLGLVSLATHIFLYAESTFKIATLPDFVESCIETRGISDVELKRLIIATRICAIASDFTVIAAITYHTRGQGILSQGLPQSRPSLVLLIQRDGE
ncbi:uncharacterized protein B0H18DRAFT_1033688 [Fomitopsis serialis]|uniref:uncharacterized protein n=1 Tax=Fomitopsis serialis TaxID=139415 RepID=UPI0020082833|nr:uncharacterized protein B0H18DRAFT_1033688 [Neoantrodia serialis]KAH9917739.1 hypothetical protein B0H18DRAFT_1033688 [Neoantrodia serialis]